MKSATIANSMPFEGIGSAAPAIAPEVVPTIQ